MAARRCIYGGPPFFVWCRLRLDVGVFCLGVGWIGVTVRGVCVVRVGEGDVVVGEGFQPSLDIFCSFSSEIIFIFLPSTAIIRSSTNPASVRMAFEVVMFESPARSSRERYMERVHPSSSKP